MVRIKLKSIIQIVVQGQSVIMSHTSHLNVLKLILGRFGKRSFSIEKSDEKSNSVKN